MRRTFGAPIRLPVIGDEHYASELGASIASQLKTVQEFSPDEEVSVTFILEVRWGLCRVAPFGDVGELVTR